MIVEEQNDSLISETVYLITHCRSALRLLKTAPISASRDLLFEERRLEEKVTRLELRLIYFRNPLAPLIRGIITIN